MAGVASTTLEGWAIPLASGSSWDHTYAVSLCGLRWGCWGVSIGGAPICAGLGSSIVADCLSQPNSTAGIRYLRTGCCQQTANRILHPAGLTVVAAGGYSVSVWGAYGRGRWHQRITCYASPPGGGGSPSAGGSPSSSRVSGGSSSSVGSDKLSNYNRAALMANRNGMDEEKIGLAELTALVEIGLGKRLDDATFKQLAEIQFALRSEQEELLRQLETGKISDKEYLDRFSRALVSAMKQSQNLLGFERFKSIFGEAGFQPERLIDPEIFFGQIRNSP
jgi:hypothetical protein